MKKKIAGVACSIKKDKLGLCNVFIIGEDIPEGLPMREIRRRIYEGEILMPEWIVRGEEYASALKTAAAVIAVRRAGKQVTHRVDPEGRPMVFDPRAGLTFEEYDKQLEILREHVRKDGGEPLF